MVKNISSTIGSLYYEKGKLKLRINYVSTFPNEDCVTKSVSNLYNHYMKDVKGSRF